MMKMKCAILVLFTLANLKSQAQDSLQVLGIDDFLEIVRVHHPVSKQADIKIDMAAANVRKSRGAFDPYAFAGLSEKYFDGKSYYKLANGGLKVPTWYGIEFNTGYERNAGAFLNPEQSMPQNGLFYAGVSASLGKGLFMDQRRAALQQAKINQKLSVAERLAVYNTLLYEAANAYWDWFMAYNNLKIYENSMPLVEQRFNATKRSAFLGDRPFIDTLESVIQLQNRQLNLQEAQLDYSNASAKLAIYLWVDGEVPLEITELTIPPIADSLQIVPLNSSFFNKLDSLSSSHPILLQYKFKIDNLGIDRQLQKEQLKPAIDFNYTPLSESFNTNALSNLNNYKWSVEMSIPIFLRRERGGLELTNLKIAENNLALRNKSAEISYKAIVSINTWEVSATQAVLYKKTVDDYLGLLKGEKQKFDAGESSVFIVNTREIGYITAQIKWVELLAKNYKAAIGAEFALGLLN